MEFAQQLMRRIGLAPEPPRRWARRATGDLDERRVLWLAVGLVAAGAVVLLAQQARARGARRQRVGDVMTPEALTIDGSVTLMEAAQRMRDANVGMLPVVEQGRLRGLVTDRDLVVRGMARGVDPAATRVIDCATREVACARADWDVEQARRVMEAHQVGRLPVVDDADRVVGVVTLGSLALRARDQEDTLRTAREVSRRSTRVA